MVADVTGFPHLGQNFAPAAIAFPHFVQKAMSAILDWFDDHEAAARSSCGFDEHLVDACVGKVDDSGRA